MVVSSIAKVHTSEWACFCGSRLGSKWDSHCDRHFASARTEHSHSTGAGSSSQHDSLSKEKMDVYLIRSSRSLTTTRVNGGQHET